MRMTVRLKGLHRSTGRNGVVYYYAWRGGPRINARPNTPEFIEEFHRHNAERKMPTAETVGGLVRLYLMSPEFEELRETTKADDRRTFMNIAAKYKDMPTRAAQAKGARKVFMDWRNSMAENPRKADRHWSTLRKLFNWAKDQELMERNPCEGGGRLYKGSRRDIIWGEAEITKFMLVAPKNLQTAMMLGVWTGQRQADLLALKWADIEDGYISLKQSKTGKRVRFLTPSPLADWLQKVERTSVYILTDQTGKPWRTRDAFKRAWRRSFDRTGLEGRTFHDLRGTCVVKWAMNDFTVPQICAVTGHEMRSAERILEEHYLAQAQGVADEKIRRLR